MHKEIYILDHGYKDSIQNLIVNIYKVKLVIILKENCLSIKGNDGIFETLGLCIPLFFFIAFFWIIYLNIYYQLGQLRFIVFDKKHQYIY